MRILVMGLPGSGKTTFANVLAEKLGADRVNADEVRSKNNFWDFSFSGRMKQAAMMYDECIKSTADHVVADFVAPYPEARRLFNPDVLIWMNTTDDCEYKDTLEEFVPPLDATFTITNFNYDNKIESIVEKIL